MEKGLTQVFLAFALFDSIVYEYLTIILRNLITEEVIIRPVLTDLPEQALTDQPAEEYYS